MHPSVLLPNILRTFLEISDRFSERATDRYSRSYYIQSSVMESSPFYLLNWLVDWIWFIDWLFVGLIDWFDWYYPKYIRPKCWDCSVEAGSCWASFSRSASPLPFRSLSQIRYIMYERKRSTKGEHEQKVQKSTHKEVQRVHTRERYKKCTRTRGTERTNTKELQKVHTQKEAQKVHTEADPTKIGHIIHTHDEQDEK